MASNKPHSTPSRSYRTGLSTPADEQVQIAFRVPAELRARFVAEASRRAVSNNYLGERALEDALDRWEKEKLP